MHNRHPHTPEDQTAEHPPDSAPSSEARAGCVDREQFKHISARAPLGMAMISPEGLCLGANRAFCEVTGYSEEELISTPLSQITHPDDLKGYLALPLMRRGEVPRHQAETRLLHADGHWIWVLMTMGLASDPHRGAPYLMAYVQDISELKRVQAELSRQALHDSLTGLPNRTLFLDRLKLALSRLERRSSMVAVLFIDLDRFKSINDSLGHDAGDELLRVVAARLQAHLRPGDSAARFGGDEFTVLCEDIDDPNTLYDIAERISEALLAPIPLPSRNVFLTGSIGVAVSDHADQQPETLIQRADAAMYQAKERGLRYELFNAEAATGPPDPVTADRALREAVERKELRVLFQPEVCLATGRIEGFEALLRWNHPTRGILTPEKFISSAEATPTIEAVGAWILKEACRQAKSWLETYGPPGLTVAVNVSARQLARSDLSAVVAGALGDTGLDASHLVLEITETVAMKDTESATTALRALRSLGVGMRIDDFGKGYSSLHYLKRLPVDTLKMDQAFVTGIGQNPADTAIIRAIVNLGRALDLQIIAEGVETADQLAELRTLGCDFAQGYFFAPPQTGEQTSALLSHRPRW